MVQYVMIKLRVSQMRVWPLAPLFPTQNTFSIPPVRISVQSSASIANIDAQFLIKMMNDFNGPIDNFDTSSCRSSLKPR